MNAEREIYAMNAVILCERPYIIPFKSGNEPTYNAQIHRIGANNVATDKSTLVSNRRRGGGACRIRLCRPVVFPGRFCGPVTRGKPTCYAGHKLAHLP